MWISHKSIRSIFIRLQNVFANFLATPETGHGIVTRKQIRKLASEFSLKFFLVGMPQLTNARYGIGILGGAVVHDLVPAGQRIFDVPGTQMPFRHQAVRRQAPMQRGA